MTKETENLLKKYWYEGFEFVLITTDNEIFVTKYLNGYGFSKEDLLNKSAQEVAYLPIEELKSLFDEENRSAGIRELINVVDWNTIEVDTPVKIIRRRTHIILRRYFKEFDSVNKRVGVFSRGCTSWSNDCGFADYYDIDETPFRRIRIAELIDEVDWYSVKKDTPVIMHNSKGDYYAHFCKYENGKIYIYQSGITSWTARNYEDDCTYCVPEDSKVYLAPERLEK